MRWTIRLLRLALLLAGVATAAAAAVGQPAPPAPVLAPPPALELPGEPPPPGGARPPAPPPAGQPAVMQFDPPAAPAPGQNVQEIAPPGTALTTLPGQTATGDNPTSRFEAAVSLEWIGPATAKLGQPVVYQLVIRNVSASPVHQVMIRNKIGQGATVTVTEPKATEEDGLLTWNLGTLEPRQEKRIDLQVVPNTKGIIDCQAFATVTGSSATRLLVREPKLAVKTAAPEKVVVGDVANVLLTVTNVGDAPANFVKVRANLSDGLEHALGKAVAFDLGTLQPNESRTVQVVCAAKGAGEQKCESQVTAEANLTADATAAVQVLQPQVELAIAGPGLRYLDRHAVYTFKVTNPGTAPAMHVSLIDEVPQGFKFVGASANGQHDFVTRTVAWFLGDLGPGQTTEVNLDLVAVNGGEHHNKATVTASRGLRAESEVLTRVEGLPALLMELVDLDDPVEVNAETSYEVRVTNTGTKTETNLQLICSIPERMEFKAAKCPQGCQFKQEGREIIFDPLPKLAPRADAIYRIFVRCVQPGDLRFRARIKADGLADPVLKEESTKVYGDDPTTPR